MSCYILWYDSRYASFSRDMTRWAHLIQSYASGSVAVSHPFSSHHSRDLAVASSHTCCVVPHVIPPLSSSQWYPLTATGSTSPSGKLNHRSVPSGINTSQSTCLIARNEPSLQTTRICMHTRTGITKCSRRVAVARCLTLPRSGPQPPEHGRSVGHSTINSLNNAAHSLHLFAAFSEDFILLSYQSAWLTPSLFRLRIAHSIVLSCAPAFVSQWCSRVTKL